MPYHVLSCIVTVLLMLLEADEDILELICNQYRGIRPVLKRWHGHGFNLLLLKFGDVVASGETGLRRLRTRLKYGKTVAAVCLHWNPLTSGCSVVQV